MMMMMMMWDGGSGGGGSGGYGRDGNDISSSIKCKHLTDLYESRTPKSSYESKRNLKFNKH